jgi:hypothetical protein
MRQGSQVLREDTYHLLSARHDDKVQQGTRVYGICMAERKWERKQIH